MLNKQTLNIYKIGSLAILLGVFGLVGSSASAGLGSVSCSKTEAANVTQTWTGHGFTCQNNTPTLNACGTTDNKQTCISKVAGDSCGLYCCVCTKPAEEVKGQGIQCKAPESVPNAAGTGCVAAASPSPATQTPQEECEDRKPEGEFQWNNELKTCESCSAPGVCCGVKLNTDVPFIGRCIRLGSTASSDDTTVVTEVTAFPRLMGGLTKILTTLILLACFGGILAGGVMIASSGGSSERAGKGKSLIKNVVIAIALLGTSGIILKLINPNFFG